jgi:hypothetical protein
MDITPDTVVCASDRQVSAHLDKEAIILGLSSGEYFGLKEVGLVVWDLLAEPRRVSDLQTAILADFDVEPERCFDDLCRLLTDLEQEDLIERVAA